MTLPELTTRQQQVVGLLSLALCRGQIAVALGISPKTVERHLYGSRSSIIARFGSKTVHELRVYLFANDERVWNEYPKACEVATDHLLGGFLAGANDRS